MAGDVGSIRKTKIIYNEENDPTVEKAMVNPKKGAVMESYIFAATQPKLVQIHEDDELIIEEILTSTYQKVSIDEGEDLSDYEII